MPPPVYTQNVIALIWDFDKTLSHDYMQVPLFRAYGVDPATFWRESGELAGYYAEVGCLASPDTIYLNHLLSYVRSGAMADLTNGRLTELGAQIELAPGLPEFFEQPRSVVAEPRYRKHEITVEHYIVSTGLRAMIDGCALRSHVDGVWACDLLPEPPPPGYLDQLRVHGSEVVCQVGYTIDNTSKTRAIFEINKGVNVAAPGTVTVNSLIPPDQRRVPIKNMIYIADGPSDIPSFSVINASGGKTLGVYAPGAANYENAALLEEQGRVNSIAEADYRPDTAATRWLLRAVRRMADQIVDARERSLSAYPGAPRHVD